VGIDVTAETTIAAPRDRVATYAMDHRNDPVWIGGVSESELLGEPPIVLGSRVRRVASFLGKRIEYVNEVERLDPGSLMVMRSVKSPFPMRVTYGFEDDGAGTRARVRVEGDAKPAYRLAQPLMARAVQRAISADVRRLKSELERADR
jgi:polyketide cyclase/dehydrase/lipid transport protein